MERFFLFTLVLNTFLFSMGEEVTMENSRNYFKGALPFTPRQSITDLVASLGVRGENRKCFLKLITKSRLGFLFDRCWTKR